MQFCNAFCFLYPKAWYFIIRIAIMLKESFTFECKSSLDLIFLEFSFRCVVITASRLTFMAICTITNPWKLLLSQRWMRTGNYNSLYFHINSNLFNKNRQYIVRRPQNLKKSPTSFVCPATKFRGLFREPYYIPLFIVYMMILC